ncbi:hypothetical protein [Nocardia stercoris]|uniref:Transmembrane protein n=1 Tax=Nocardia stercoris TaxID=2483361 RepID=A0A3M2LEF4_9NOCA|nr:hypothetical protein [Nocardia stercoris]RMI34963.1 hypothetical protein EBN03_00995 [Nocardia stercoris]
MIALRMLLIAGGIWLAWHGISLLLHDDPADLKSIAFWFVGGILVHDALFAPLCAAAGVGARRLLPRSWWAPVACGAVCTVVLAVLAVPVIGRRNAVPDNPSVLDRNYAAGLVVALAVVWILVALVLLQPLLRLDRLKRFAALRRKP